MSKMDRMLNSKKEKQTIYEIYRACRLCGAGAGYKMPIIQNVVDLDDNDVELKQKIRECVQIEVHQDDKMPPLICELCVDKVNDFYEFLEMCRQTNKRTRLRLGLPPQSLPGGAPDAGDCILGLTEPVYVNDDSDGEPLSKHRKPSRENKTNVLIKKEVTRGRGGRYSKKEPTPPRALRKNRNSREDASITTTQERTSRQSPKVSPKAAPKSILKKSEDTLISSRLKRTRDKDPVKLESPVKKVKIALKPVSPAAKSSARSGRKASPPCGLRCVVCDSRHKTAQALASHLRTHGVGYTSNNLACNPCGEWFPSARLAARHLRQHRARPCRCQRCGRSYATIHAYDQHITNDECLIWPHVPDVKCESCWNMFPTDNLLRLHRCLGEDHRPGGKCSKCNRNYALLKNLKKHESTCTAKRKKEPRVPGRVLAQLRPLQVRVARCDALLRGLARGRCDVSGVAADFGLDKNCIYPYKSSFSNLGIKSELDSFGGMVSINPDVKNEFCASEYVHWDSEESESDSDISLLPLTKKIDTLATLSLKIIFSNKCLGKVPRKRRRVKKEKVFEALDTEDDVTRDINNIINNLDKDDDLDAVDNLDNSGNDSIKTGSESKNNHTDKEFDFSNDFNDSKSLNDVNSHNNSLLVDNNGTINNSDGKIEENNTIVDKVKDSESSNKSDENSDGIENSVVHKDDDVGACLNSDENKCVTDDDDEKSKEISEQENDDCLTDKVDEENVNDETENAQINEEITKNDDDVNFEGKVDENDVLQDEINRDDDSQTNVDASNDSFSKVNETGDVRNETDDLSGANNDDRSANDGNLPEISTKDDLNGANDNSLSEIIENEDSRVNIDTNNESPSEDDKNDVNDGFKANINDCQSNKDEQPNANDSVNDEISQNSQDTDSKMDENLLLTQKDSQDSNEIKNECVNDEVKMAANERLSVSDSKSEEYKINGDSYEKNSEQTDRKSAEDIEDSKLMAALDAEIGESDQTSDVPEKSGSYGFNDKIALEDLLTEKNTTKSMDLDILPEDYNFDN